MIKKLVSLSIVAIFVILLAPFMICKAATSLSPLICLDNAGDNTYLRSSFTVCGWSLNTSGVSKVEAKVDGTLVGTATFGVREDVSSAYPQYASTNPNSGFTINCTVNMASFTAGNHTLTVTAYGNDGTTSSSAFNVKKLPPITNVDYPQMNQQYNNTSIYVGGWAVNSSDITSVSLYVDNNLLQTLTHSQLAARPDVYQALNKNGAVGYQDAQNSGFSFSIDINQISPGSHTIKLVSIGNDGQKDEVNRQITVAKPSPLICLDNTGDCTYLRSSFTVIGWSLNASGVSKIEAKVDGTLVGTAAFIERNDVSNAYPKYASTNPKSGFTINCSVDMTSFTAGDHTLIVTAYGNDGTTGLSSINIKKLSPITNIDSPQMNQQYNNASIYVGGWAVNSSGVSSVSVYLDGAVYQTLSHDQLTNRPDVYQAVNRNGMIGYTDAKNSGYAITLDVNKIMPGIHTIKVLSTGNDGQTDEVTRQITVTKPTPLMCLDNAYDIEYMSETGNLCGWSLNASGVDHIDAAIDDKRIGSAVFIQRDDVLSTYPQYAPNNSKSGFLITTTINVADYSEGNHTLKLTAFGKDGTSYSTFYTITRAPTLIDVDTPNVNGQTFTYKDTSMNISGWAVSTSGIKQVDFYIDNSLINTITTFSERDDVQSVVNKNGHVGYYNASSSGYSFEFTLNSMSYGSHILKIIAENNDGTTKTVSLPFFKSYTAYTQYNITLSNMLKLQQAANSAVVQNDIDPNYLKNNGSGIYEFLDLKWQDNGTITADMLNNVISQDGAITNKDDVLLGKGAVFLQAAQSTGVNPIYLVAHARLETGNGTSDLARGTGTNPGYYNMYGIGAVDSDPIKGGSATAKNNGWDSVDKAIIGGAKWIANNYIYNSKMGSGYYDQDNLYEMKWNPEGTVKHGYACSEYATGRTWAYSIAGIISNFSKYFIGNTYTYEIPIYLN